MKPFKIKGRKGYYFSYPDYERPKGKRWRTLKGGNTYEDAVIARARAVERSNKIRDGLVTARELNAADRMKACIAGEDGLLEQWRKHMQGQRITQSKIDTWVRYVELITEDRMPPISMGGNRKIVEAGPKGRNAILSLSELDPNSVGKYLQRLTNKTYNRGLSTRNEYLTALKACVAWVRGTSKDCPLACLSKLNAKKDRRREKRGLTVPEFGRFIASVPEARSGGARTRQWYQAFYLVAGRCGGRWSEIARLHTDHIQDGYIHFDAAITKTGESGDVEMLPEVERALRLVMPERGLIFGAKPTRRTFIRHLALADIPYKLDERIVSLRVTLCSQLIAAGAIPAETKRIMRHANIETTFKYYNDITLTTGGGAMQRLAGQGQKERKMG